MIVVADKEVGWVNKIGVHAVSVVTRDGKEHLIPNEDLMTKAVKNWSYTDRNVRVRVPVSVAYDCDLKLAQELMLRAASAARAADRRGKPPLNDRQLLRLRNIITSVLQFEVDSYCAAQRK